MEESRRLNVLQPVSDNFSLCAYDNLTFRIQLPVNVCEIIPQCVGGGIGKAGRDIFQTMGGLEVVRLLGVREVTPFGSADGI